MFLLPGLGGASAELEQFRRGLCAHARVVLLDHMPDIDRPEREATDLEAVVRRLVVTVRTRAGLEPYVMMGYSLGGYIGFEVAARLAATGLPSQRIVLIDAPSRYQPVRDRPLKSELRHALEGSPPHVAFKLVFLLLKTLKLFEAARLFLRGVQRVMGERVGPMSRHRLLTAFWWRAVRGFKLTKTATPVVLYRPAKPLLGYRDPTLGWTDHAAALEIVRLPQANHWSMLTKAQLLDDIVGRLGRRP